MRFASTAVALGFCIAILAGCDDSTPPAPNQPPDTFITGSVPADSSRVPHKLDIFWRGVDADGTPAYFEYILDTYPRSANTIDDFTVQVPAVGDPRWASGRVNANHRIIVTLADTLRVDPRTAPPPLAFDRWHTFFIRAVDNEGTIDDTPDHRTFQAYTAAPILELVEPLVRGDAVSLPRTLVVNWNGDDPIGTSTSPGELQDPVEARWVSLRCTLDGNGEPLGFPDSLYAVVESRWSPWAAWNTVDGRSAVLRDLVPAGSGTQAFVVAVQGRDDAGAITPRFETVQFGNNYGAFIADGSLATGPSLTIFVRHTRTDTLQVAGNGSPPSFTLAVESDSVLVSWNRPSGRHYGASGTDTRFGWDIQEPDEDLEWSAWNTVRSASPRLVGTGRVFHLQGRDDVGRTDPNLHQVTSVTITINPAPVTARRN